MKIVPSYQISPVDHYKDGLMKKDSLYPPILCFSQLSSLSQVCPCSHYICNNKIVSHFALYRCDFVKDEMQKDISQCHIANGSKAIVTTESSLEVKYDNGNA